MIACSQNDWQGYRRPRNTTIDELYPAVFRRKFSSRCWRIKGSDFMLADKSMFGRFGKNLCRWLSMPMNDLSCFNVLGGSRANTATILEPFGLKPSESMSKRNQDIWFEEASHFDNLRANPSSSSLTNTFSTTILWSTTEPFEKKEYRPKNKN